MILLASTAALQARNLNKLGSVIIYDVFKWKSQWSFSIFS
jgi:hypothetical protein